MSVFEQVQKDLDTRFAAAARKFHNRHVIVIGEGGEGVSWRDFRHVYLQYASYPPEFGTSEPYFENIVLNFSRYELRVPVIAMLDAEPAVHGPDTLDEIILQPLKQKYIAFERAFLNSAQPTSGFVPLRLKLQWTRRLAIEFSWEGRILALKARQSPLQEFLNVPGAYFGPSATKPAEVSTCLRDDADYEKVRQTIDMLLAGQAGEWWFEADLPNRAAEELRKTWSARYRSLTWLRNSVASWAAPGAFVLAVFLAAYLDQFRTGTSHQGTFGKHLRIALEAHRKHPRAELLLNLGQAAHRLQMDRTAWYLLMLSARSLPAGSHKQLLKYHYSPWLLSAFGDLARKGGATDLATQYNTWFEERVLAEGMAAPELPAMLSSLGIASD